MEQQNKGWWGGGVLEGVRRLNKREGKESKKDREGGEEESQSPLSLMQFLCETPNLFEQTHKLHVHTLQA